MSGPKGLIDSVKSVKTRRILLDNTIFESFDYPVKVDKPNVPGISITPPEVMAQVEVRLESVTRRFRTVPLKVLEPVDNDLKVTPLSTPHVEVEVSGRKEEINTLKLEQIKAFVDLSASPFNEPGSYKVQVDCWIANAGSVVIKKITPQQIQVSIEKIKSDNTEKK